jgi:hypothetical protein
MVFFDIFIMPFILPILSPVNHGIGIQGKPHDSPPKKNIVWGRIAYSGICGNAVCMSFREREERVKGGESGVR